MRRTLVLLACLLTFSVSSGSVNAKLQGLDSLVFSRLFSYQKNHQQEIKGYSTNVYTKLLHQTHHVHHCQRPPHIHERAVQPVHLQRLRKV